MKRQSIAGGYLRAEWVDIMRIHIKPVRGTTIENNANPGLDIFNSEQTLFDEAIMFQQGTVERIGLPYPLVLIHNKEAI